VSYTTHCDHSVKANKISLKTKKKQYAAHITHWLWASRD